MLGGMLRPYRIDSKIKWGRWNEKAGSRRIAVRYSMDALKGARKRSQPMEKNNKNRNEDARRKALQARSGKTKLTVGIDLGDEWSHCCFLGEEGEIVEE